MNHKLKKISEKYVRKANLLTKTDSASSPGTYMRPSQTAMVELFTKIVIDFYKKSPS